MSIRFLHAADLHLGLRITRFDKPAADKIAEARFQSIDRIRRLAQEKQVDFIVVAGDLFDDHSVDRHISGRVFGLFEGSGTQCPVFLIPGNHDPLAPGGVWDRDPWSRPNPPRNWRLLRESQPVSLENLPVDLFPCPLRDRRDINDPTAWIAGYPKRSADRFRIGIAHGSLKVLPNLPMDDHLIREDAAEAYGLDYLALGHWHSPFPHKDSAGVVRTAYPGTHEPMMFPGTNAGDSLGWTPRSDTTGRFEDDGRGSVLLVTIDSPGAPPMLETVPVGELKWEDRRIEFTATDLGSRISEFGHYPDPHRTIFRLRLAGVLDPERHARVLAELTEGILKRFHDATSCDASGLLIEPTPDQLHAMVGPGILKTVLEGLEADVASPDPEVARVGRHARNLLYQISWEARK